MACEHGHSEALKVALECGGKELAMLVDEVSALTCEWRVTDCVLCECVCVCVDEVGLV